MTTTEATPQFKIGDRVFSHYCMEWGTIEGVRETTPPTTHGVTGSPLPGTTWYMIRMDDTRREYLDDGGGDWELARIVPPQIAQRYGYGADPKATA